jgi:hypothetical protein
MNTHHRNVANKAGAFADDLHWTRESFRKPGERFALKVNAWIRQQERALP